MLLHGLPANCSELVLRRYKATEFTSASAKRCLKEITAWQSGLLVYSVPDWALRGVDFRAPPEKPLYLIAFSTFESSIFERQALGRICRCEDKGFAIQIGHPATSEMGKKTQLYFHSLMQYALEKENENVRHARATGKTTKL